MFTVKENGVGEICFILDEDTNTVLELTAPADLEQARRVAQFLNANVKSVKRLTSRSQARTS